MPSRLTMLALTFVAIVAAAACDDAVTPQGAEVELYLDGTLAGDAPNITFAKAIAAQDQRSADIELRNLGPGRLALSGSRPVRIERDDRLAFSVTTPAATTLAPGESATLTVFFRPGSPGHNEARVVIEVADREPIVVTLVGDAISAVDEKPVLDLKVEGKPAVGRYDFGAIAPNQTAHAKVTITNGGTGELVLPEVSPVALSGNGFSVNTLSRYLLSAGESVDLDVTFAPTQCASYGATLTLRSETPASTSAIELVGRGGTNPQGYDGVTDALAQPDGDVALSNADGGVRRFVVGNLAVANLNGRVGVHSWDGCTLGGVQTITPISAGLGAGLVGTQVALDERGKLLLVTARDNAEAWIFELQPDNKARLAATLATTLRDQDNGRGAALAADGTAAFIGVPMADSGFNKHGVVLAYDRPAAGTWTNTPEARWRLAPSNAAAVQQVGGWVEASGDGTVVAAGGFSEPSGGAGALGPPRVYVWESTGTLGQRVWGELPSAQAEPDTRVESASLTITEGIADIAALALSRDGATIALPAPNAVGDLVVYVWTRPGASWKGASPTPTGSVTMSSNVKPRVVLGRDGSFLLVADADGAREVLRPSEGWSASASPGRAWNVPFFGGITLAPDDAAFAGLDKNGRGWLVWR